MTYVGDLRAASLAAFPRIKSWYGDPVKTPGGSAISVEEGRLRGRPADFRQAVGIGYFELTVDLDIDNSAIELTARLINGVELAGARIYRPSDWLDSRLADFSEAAPAFLPALRCSELARTYPAELRTGPMLHTINASATSRLYYRLRKLTDGK